ncbi:hypothetical protein D043_0535B, partial [Vibrio parahaemolyticus EKP-021]
PAY